MGFLNTAHQSSLENSHIQWFFTSSSSLILPQFQANRASLYGSDRMGVGQRQKRCFLSNRSKFGKLPQILYLDAHPSPFCSSIQRSPECQRDGPHPERQSRVWNISFISNPWLSGTQSRGSAVALQEKPEKPAASTSKFVAKLSRCFHGR